MANKYTNLIGTNKVKDEYKKINTGFDKVEADINDANSRITAVDNRVDAIITTPIDDEAAAQELVDARAGFSTIGGRMTKIEEDIETYKAESVYLQVDEPPGANPTTLWFKVDGEINFSQGGVVIENAETSAAPPETFYWFEPIL